MVCCFARGQAAQPRLEYSGVPMHETWSAMEALHASGQAKHIGLCNVGTAGLRDVLSYATVAPEVLQVERHLYLQQPNLLRMANEVKPPRNLPLLRVRRVFQNNTHTYL